MRSAGRKQLVSTRAMPATHPESTKCISVADSPIGEELPSDDPSIASVIRKASDDRDAHHRALEVVIRQRIEMRLPGRVRNLHVRSSDNLVILEGQCATYYTKQLAQHAAMGVLEEEKHLENAIVVNVGR
jgi:hypothetical protein